MIAIVPYDPTWPGAFMTLARPLRARLGNEAERIDHIGSTAVPGLAAKDKIDIQVTIRDFRAIEPVIAAITNCGYQFYPDPTYDHRPPGEAGPDSNWEKALFTSLPEYRPANIHVRAEGRPNQRY